MQRSEHDRLTPAIQGHLQKMHPDPFIQVAIWRLYLAAPWLLDPTPYVTLARTEGMEWDDMVDARRHNTTPQEEG